MSTSGWNSASRVFTEAQLPQKWHLWRQQWTKRRHDTLKWNVDDNKRLSEVVLQCEVTLNTFIFSLVTHTDTHTSSPRALSGSSVMHSESTASSWTRGAEFSYRLKQHISSKLWNGLGQKRRLDQWSTDWTTDRSTVIMCPYFLEMYNSYIHICIHVFRLWLNSSLINVWVDCDDDTHLQLHLMFFFYSQFWSPHHLSMQRSENNERKRTNTQTPPSQAGHAWHRNVCHGW